VTPLGLLDVGPVEALVIAVAAVMLFGGDLPDIARRTGHYIGRLRAAANDLARQFDAPADLLKLPEPDDEMHRPPRPTAAPPRELASAASAPGSAPGSASEPAPEPPPAPAHPDGGQPPPPPT